VKKTIAVIGSDGDIDPRVEEVAEEIGRRLAMEDVVVVCGGLGGVMQAVCRGAREKDGLTVGILPSMDKEEANPYVDVALTTGLGHARNIFVAASADAVVALSGSTGTLSEIALALNNKKHVYLVEDTGGVSERFKDLIQKKGRERFIHRVDSDTVVDEVLKNI